ncbi:hypothetical protein EVAR_27672_1 [Eumeta japonica]|uniref:Integrase catalytic domain-containing protein n=1 Tax=Eumeta variegata TaxID=151549 RepID=A0A4C1V0H6_EUMVA|nr:hypothetical protein EVAR_27672_1 [Eumeta japonica]
MVESHVFGNESEKAYAVVAYWREVRTDGLLYTVLVAGKARVAPNKPISIPRLELQAALLACRLASTARSFSCEIAAIRLGKLLPAASHLRELGPALIDGALRFGGRVRRASALTPEEKHPVILDGRNRAAQLLVDHYHRQAGHGNHETVVNLLRER